MNPAKYNINYLALLNTPKDGIEWLIMIQIPTTATGTMHPDVIGDEDEFLRLAFDEPYRQFCRILLDGNLHSFPDGATLSGVIRHQYDPSPFGNETAPDLSLPWSYSILFPLDNTGHLTQSAIKQATQGSRSFNQTIDAAKAMYGRAIRWLIPLNAKAIANGTSLAKEWHRYCRERAA